MDQLKTIESAFRENRTRRLGYRLLQLRALHELVSDNVEDVRAAIKADIGLSTSNASSNHITAITNLLAEQANVLYERLTKRAIHDVDVVASRSVLVIGSRQDPIGSIICPLALAIAAGTCVVLRPSHEAPATRSLVLRLIPRYLDREAYAVTEAPFEELLQLGFESLVHTDPLPAGAQASGMRVLQCESGLNVLCHLDGTAAMQQCAAIIKQSEAMANPQTKLNIVFVLPEEIDSLTEEVRKLLSRKVKIGTHQDALSATRKSDLIVVPATSTEEAIFTLQACKIDRFAYFGDESYGAYMLKFLPNAVAGYVNNYDFDAQWPSLSIATFQKKRPFISSRLPSKVPSPAVTKKVDFPVLNVDYSKPFNFFLLGLTVSQMIIRTAALGSTAIVAYGAWRIYIKHMVSL